MTNDILLTISGLHATDGDAEDPVEQITPGRYFWKNGKHYVLFEEVLEGLEGTVRSTLKFTEEKIELLRNGTASAHMVFEKGKEHSMIYRTPMGPLQISIDTEEIFMEIQESQICVQIDYVLKAGEEVLTESTVRLNICEKGLKTIVD